MNGIKLGGFFISAGAQKTILVVFTVYSVAVIALGMLVHLKSRKTSRFSDFLTGGGKLNVMEVAMISAMGSMAGGTMIAGSITKDLYVDCFGGKAEEKKLKQINIILFAVFCCLCALIALNQNQLGQLLVILSAGGIALSFGVPYFFGVYWGKATAAGALASSVGVVISYVFLYYCSYMQWYQEYLWSINPLIPALIITILLMVGVSLKTQD